MKKLLFTFLVIFITACAKDKDSIIDIDEPVDELSATEVIFLEEYHFVTFNLSPTSFGGNLNEKWEQELKLFLDGNFPVSYRDDVDTALQSFNGPISSIETIWPDMYQAASTGGFSGYALYNGSNSAINGGRIWVETNSIPLFKHELGHIIGLGHASDTFCGEALNLNDSFMCVFLADDFSSFDAGILKLLYHPNIEKGKSFEALKPDLEALILDDVVSF